MQNKQKLMFATKKNDLHATSKNTRFLFFLQVNIIFGVVRKTAKHDMSVLPVVCHFGQRFGWFC